MSTKTAGSVFRSEMSFASLYKDKQSDNVLLQASINARSPASLHCSTALRHHWSFVGRHGYLPPALATVPAL